MGRKILVAGGRDYNDWLMLAHTLNRLHAEDQIEAVVHGAMTGADALASRWCYEMKVDTIAYGAKWGANGGAGGPVRNRIMLEIEEPALVVAFPGGRGTFSCVTLARDFGFPVMEVE